MRNSALWWKTLIVAAYSIGMTSLHCESRFMQHIKEIGGGERGNTTGIIPGDARHFGKQREGEIRQECLLPGSRCTTWHRQASKKRGKSGNLQASI